MVKVNVRPGVIHSWIKDSLRQLQIPLICPKLASVFTPHRHWAKKSSERTKLSPCVFLPKLNRREANGKPAALARDITVPFVTLEAGQPTYHGSRICPEWIFLTLTLFPMRFDHR